MQLNLEPTILTVLEWNLNALLEIKMNKIIQYVNAKAEIFVSALR